MKNITMSCEEALIRRARERASRENTTLNAVFRQWLARYIGQDRSETEYQALMQRLSYARAGRHFSRDELNER
ncbi:MAG: hypothetical protein GY856_19410 [bacterium]|nr:hypothetical protein [bacterium]